MVLFHSHKDVTLTSTIQQEVVAFLTRHIHRFDVSIRVFQTLIMEYTPVFIKHCPSFQNLFLFNFFPTLSADLLHLPICLHPLPPPYFVGSEYITSSSSVKRGLLIRFVSVTTLPFRSAFGLSPWFAYDGMMGCGYWRWNLRVLGLAQSFILLRGSLKMTATPVACRMAAPVLQASKGEAS
jgi:hypothetical protein